MGNPGQPDASEVLELVLADRTRVPLVRDVTIGSARGSTLRLDDPAVSPSQARISVVDDNVLLEDAGSSYGTWLDGRRLDGRERLREGSRIRVGDQELVVERHRDEDEAGPTALVPARASRSVAVPTTPRLRSSCALTRLEASEGDKRWVLRDLRRNTFLRMSDADADLLELLDGVHSVPELVRTAEQREGEAGPARLARLLTALEERGLLAGVRDADTTADRRSGARLAASKELTWQGPGEFFRRLDRGSGRLLRSPAALEVIAVLIVVGLVAFPLLVAGRYGTPFMVDRKVGVGALTFVLGWLVVVAVRETARGLVIASYGRRVHRARLNLRLVFPYASVDTSDAWFEPRRHRIAISAAGPISDLSLGALFSICCLALPAGTLRDILFQLAFGAYVAAVLNLNPFVERDGYHILVDPLRDRRLRRRVRERYAAASVAWSALAVCFAVGMSLRYAWHLTEIAAKGVAWAALIVLWFGFFLPLVVVLAGPLRQRRLGREARADKRGTRRPLSGSSCASRTPGTAKK